MSFFLKPETALVIRCGREVAFRYSQLIEKKGKTYHISAVTDLSAQIASTFRFTDQTLDISKWKTYTNEKYGFEIKYPPNWTTTDIFSILGGKNQAVAFVKKESENKLKSDLIPDSDVGGIVIQGNAFFFMSANDEPLYVNREKNKNILKIEERNIGDNK